ncbi:MAG: glycosyltransferase [Reichenbachiella sp.]
MASKYLERYAVQQTYIDPTDYRSPKIIVVIPCHNEKYLIESLQSLEHCENPKEELAIIVVINASEKDSEEIHKQNEATLIEAQLWVKKESRKFDYHFIIDNYLPKKHAGVGLARKIGMDEAIRIFESIHHDGVILCYDADSICESNLLVEVERLFANDKIQGCSIHYEHPLEGDLPNDNYTGIINYELHLRYYIDALKYAGFPYAYQTIGSSMAVRSSSYQKQGGMNRRKAGEDFYFLHRIIPLGNFKNLNSTRIIPSPRSSDRVPFGTGKAIGDWLETKMDHWETYNPRIFHELKLILEQVDSFYENNNLNKSYLELPQVFHSFVSKEEFCAKLEEIIIHSTTLMNFRRRFYQWMDGFKVLKFVHHARDNGYSNVDIDEAIQWLMLEYQQDLGQSNKKEKLILLREIDRKEQLF